MKPTLLLSCGLAMSALSCQQHNEAQKAQKQPVAKTCDNLPHPDTVWRSALREACIADSWQPGAVECFFSATSLAQATDCTKKLSVTQQDYLEYRGGSAAKRPSGWACQKLKAQFEPLLKCTNLSEHATIYINETKQIVEEVLGVFANQPSPEQARTTELRCISVARLLAEFVGSAPCPS